MNQSSQDHKRKSTHLPEGRAQRRYSRNSLTNPIYQTATFTFENSTSLAAFHRGDSEGHFYSRYGNPTVTATEKRLSQLEGAEASLLYSSGMAAVSSVFWGLLAPQTRLVLLGETYRHTRDFAETLLSRYQVKVDFLEENNINTLAQVEEDAIRVLFTEIPSNPTMRIPDIAHLAQWANERKARLVVDSTIASPILLRPLELGAHLVVHSATKYLGGHNDLLAGAVSGSRAMIDALSEQQALLGAIISPHSAFLLDRGLKTLQVRVERQSQTAMRLSEYLSGCKQIKCVYYPGLDSHPDHQIALQQMSAFGGLLSFELHGGPNAADRLVDSLQIPVLAPGFGGTESQVEHHARMAYADLGLEGAHARGIVPGLIRFSVGLEDFEVLRDDLSEGLKKI